jgi:hypothetical protein
MKFVLICIVFICVTAIAIINLTYYKSKQRLLFEFIDFLKIYASDVAFSKTSLQNIIDRVVAKYSKNMQILLTNYRHISSYPPLLSENERATISVIFSGMGKGDVETEVSYINNSIDKMQTMLEVVNLNYATRGELRSKLIFMFGIMLILILL